MIFSGATALCKNRLWQCVRQLYCIQRLWNFTIKLVSNIYVKTMYLIRDWLCLKGPFNPNNQQDGCCPLLNFRVTSL